MTARQGVYLDSCVLLSLFLADKALIQAAHHLGVAHHWISEQPI